jgi:uncharacterized membrane protein
MKYYLILFFAFSFIYYVFEAIFNRVSMGAIVETKLKKPKHSFWCYTSLWMLPFGGVIAVVFNLFLLIPIFNKIQFLPLLMLIGCIIITGVELLGGLLLNKKLKLNIWDYSNSKIKIGSVTIPLNFKGQIDIYHSILWAFMSLPILYFSKIIEWLAK